jgi:hypothetical protein
MHGAVLSVKNDEYASYYRDGQGPRKLRLDTCYGLSFRLCLLHMVSEVIRRLGHDKRFERTRLNIVMESGNRHAGDAERAFNEEASDLAKSGCDLLAGVTFALKDRCDPLMVADFLAHTTFMRGENGFPPPPLSEVARVKSEKTSLLHLGFDPGGLAEYKSSLVERYEARRRRPLAVGSE